MPRKSGIHILAMFSMAGDDNGNTINSHKAPRLDCFAQRLAAVFIDVACIGQLSSGGKPSPLNRPSMPKVPFATKTLPN